MMKLSISLSFLLPIILEETNANDPYWYWYSTPEEIESYRNGVVSTLACPLGTYRDFGDRKTRRHGGIGVEGCIPCPKGRYGSSNDLTSSYCTGACPVGTYLDKTGGKSRHDCKPCPVGTFGDTEGLTTKECSGFCSDLNTVKTKYYGRDEGLTSRNGCIKCSDGYLDPRGQCNNVHDVIMQYMRKN